MIQQNIRDIRSALGETKLIVVSKFRSVEELRKVYECGEREFAENRVQEILKKKDLLPGDIRWHLIGHLQTNKVKQVLPYVDMIHSADRLKLLDIIEKEAAALNKIVQVLLQVHVSLDESKFGFQQSELLNLARDMAFHQYNYIRFCGIMTMTTLGATTERIHLEFSQTDDLFHLLKPLMPNPDIFKELSMGMSGDYKFALEHGATMVRIGSLIFD